MNFINRLFQRKETHQAYKKGMAFYNQIKFLKAIECFEPMLAEKPKSNSMEYNLAQFYCSQAYKNIGIIEFTKHNSKQALSYFKMALKYNPKHTDLNYFIGICLNNIGNFQGAMESFKKLQEIDPDNIPNKLKIAIIFFNLEMWDNAEKINRDILEKNPNYADVHFNLGLSLIHQGKASEAAQSFQDALNINPNYINAKIKLGVAQASMGQFDDAFKNLNSIIEEHPNYADVNYLLGVIKEECSQTLEAVEHLKKAVSISPKFKNAQVKLVLFYCKLGKIDIANKQIKQALSFYPDDKRLNNAKKLIHKIVEQPSKPSEDFSIQLGNVLGGEKLLADLVNEFHKNLDIMPNFSEIFTMFSSSKYTQNDSSISEFMIPLISEYIRKNPTYPDLYNNLGVQLLSCNRTNEAEEAFKKAVELNPEYVTARINLFKTLYKNSKPKEAYEHGKKLFSKNLPYPDVYYTIAKILVELKKYDKALENANKVLAICPSMEKVHLLRARIYEDQGQKHMAIGEIKKCLASEIDSKLSTKAQIMLQKLQESFEK